MATIRSCYITTIEARLGTTEAKRLLFYLGHVQNVGIGVGKSGLVKMPRLLLDRLDQRRQSGLVSGSRALEGRDDGVVHRLVQVCDGAPCGGGPGPDPVIDRIPGPGHRDAEGGAGRVPGLLTRP